MSFFAKFNSQNYFSVFGLPEQFEINIFELEKKHEELLQKYHPDKFANSNKQDLVEAVSVGALINQAFDKLKNPISRAQYLLKIWGYDKVLQDRYIPPEFVDEQILWRERIIECKNFTILENHINEINRNINNIEISLKDDFYRLRTVDVVPNNIAQSIKQLQLWQKLLELALDKEI